MSILVPVEVDEWVPAKDDVSPTETVELRAAENYKIVALLTGEQLSFERVGVDSTYVSVRKNGDAKLCWDVRWPRQGRHVTGMASNLGKDPFCEAVLKVRMTPPEHVDLVFRFRRYDDKTFGALDGTEWVI